MNSVILMGRLTKDPEIRYSTGENAMAIGSFSIAVDRRVKKEGQPTADFFNCTVFGKSAEFLEKYFHKGNRVLVSGSIQNDSYTNKDGQKVNATKIIVNNLEFCESKQASGDSSDTKGNKDGFMSIPEGLEDELPFA